MKLKNQIDQSLKNALLTKNEVVKNTLRQLKSALQNQSLSKGNVNEELSDTEILSTIRKLIKQREDSITAFTGRNDLIEKELAEIEVLKEFLPQEMDEKELDSIIQQTIQELSATTKKEMGKVIKSVVEKVAGRVGNKTISQKVGEKLS